MGVRSPVGTLFAAIMSFSAPNALPDNGYRISANGVLFEVQSVPERDFNRVTARKVALATLAKRSASPFHHLTITVSGDRAASQYLLSARTLEGTLAQDLKDYTRRLASPLSLAQVVRSRSGATMQFRVKDGPVFREQLWGTDPLKLWVEETACEILDLIPRYRASLAVERELLGVGAAIRCKGELSERLGIALLRRVAESVAMPIEKVGVMVRQDQWFPGSAFCFPYPFGELPPEVPVESIRQTRTLECGADGKRHPTCALYRPD